MTLKSSVQELKEQLLVACSNNKILREIPDVKIKEMIDTLVLFQFSEDNRRSAQNNLGRIINQIVDTFFEEDLS